MKKSTIAGLLSFAGGIVIISIWIYFIVYGLGGQEISFGSAVEQLAYMLNEGGSREFFIYSTLITLGCFISGATFISSKLPELGITIVIANTVAVSLMFAWFVAAIIVSPLLLSKWVLKGA